MPGHETERRRALAERVTAAIVPATGPAAVLLVGSAAEGNADHLSDIDLIALYDRLPEPEAFRAVVTGLGATPRLRIGEEPGRGFSDSYVLDGVELQTGGSTVSSVEERVEAVRSGADPGEPSTKVLLGLLHGVALHGSDRVEALRERAGYPDALQRAVVERGLAMFPYWLAREQLAARDAMLFEVQSLLDGAFAILSMVSALNRVYFTSFQYKRMHEHVAAMEVAPPDLARRVESLFGPDRDAAAAELRALYGEVVALVEDRLPDVDTTAARRRLGTS